MKFYIEAYDEDGEVILGNLDGQGVIHAINYKRTAQYKALSTFKTLDNRVCFYRIESGDSSHTIIYEKIKNKTFVSSKKPLCFQERELLTQTDYKIAMETMNSSDLSLVLPEFSKVLTKLYQKNLRGCDGPRVSENKLVILYLEKLSFLIADDFTDVYKFCCDKAGFVSKEPTTTV